MMDIYLIGQGEDFPKDLPEALRESGHRVSQDGEIHQGLDAVILGRGVGEEDPDFKKAVDLGLEPYSLAEFLYEHAKHKTRVVLAGGPGRATATAMVLHVLRYNEIAVDYALVHEPRSPGPSISLSETNDFMVLEGEERPNSTRDPRPVFQIYNPNIALVVGLGDSNGPSDRQEDYRIFLEQIVKGGSITYNEQDPGLREMVEATDHPIRKFPYATPAHRAEGGLLLLDTPEGEMPLEGFGKQDLLHMAGAQWICQQLGVDQAEFYQAMTAF